MKLLKTRTEIGKALSFAKYPVLTIDLADADEYGLKGCRVRIDAGHFSTGERYLVDATLRVYRDERKLTVSSGGTCLSASFTYSDLVKRAEIAQAPIIEKDQEVVIVVLDSKNKQMYAPMLVKTSSRVDPHCSKPIGFEDVDMTIYLLAAGCELMERA